MLQQLLAFGNRPRLIDFRVPDDTLAVEHKGRPLVHTALVVEHTVSFADRAMGPVIGQQGEGYAAQLFSPYFQARNGVSTDLQNLDVQLLEFFVVRTEPGDLILSPAGKRERKE